MGPQSCEILVRFWTSFFRVLKPFKCLVGAFLGLPSLSWTTLDPNNLKQIEKLFNVFANAGFWVFEALGGPLGPILAPPWADLVPKWSPKWPPK